MTDKISIDPRTTALLAMDFQAHIVDGYATDEEALLARTARLLEAVRSVNMQVIYVVVGFRPGYPEVSARNMSFHAIKRDGPLRCRRTECGDSFCARTQASRSRGHKASCGRLAGTDLDMILRANGIETLLLTGIATSGVVLSTLRHAADAD